MLLPLTQIIWFLESGVRADLSWSAFILLADCWSCDCRYMRRNRCVMLACTGLTDAFTSSSFYVPHCAPSCSIKIGFILFVSNSEKSKWSTFILFQSMYSVLQHELVLFQASNCTFTRVCVLILPLYVCVKVNTPIPHPSESSSWQLYLVYQHHKTGLSGCHISPTHTHIHTMAVLAVTTLTHTETVGVLLLLKCCSSNCKVCLMVALEERVTGSLNLKGLK